ncbi:MAG: MBL fold metallo-hydrolase [Patescibacteria group bacterium]
MQSKIFFYGGAGAVTGSNFLLDTGSSKILIDCGLRQGMDEASNAEPFDYNPADVSHLIVTHAHLDHIGRIPKLVKDGFRGVIISTKATRALAEPLLLDALEILTRNAEHHGAPALYEEQDVAAAMGLWRGIGYHEKVPLPDNIELELLDAGHILGSAMARFERGGKTLVFTGDLGGGNSPLLRSTEEVSPTYLVMESTYGDKTRPEDVKRFEHLENAIEDAVTRGGTLLIPAFSTERTQDLLFDIRRLYLEHRVPEVPVYLDSPLAEKITHAYLAHPEYFADDIRKRVEGGEKIFSFPGLHFVEQVEDSRKLDNNPNSKIILAGSGMSSGGRVLVHERRYLPDQNSTLLIVGYQAAGTIGRRLIEGAKTLEFYKPARPNAGHSGGDKIPVRAAIKTLYGYSAHKDGEELLEFANKAGDGVKEIFLVHGEPAASMFLAQRIRDYLGTKATVPEPGESVTIDF